MSVVPSTTSRIKVRGLNPRRNLPMSTSRKRGESNFLAAFERTYLSTLKTSGVIWQDFAVEGYGIADLIWVACSSLKSGTRALSLLGLRHSLEHRTLTAFELKLSSWRAALMQAHRYRYFADRAIVVIPCSEATRAMDHRDLFQTMGVGLWSFCPQTRKLIKLWTPRGTKPKNKVARKKAIASLLTSVKFRKTFKQFQPPK